MWRPYALFFGGVVLAGCVEDPLFATGGSGGDGGRGSATTGAGTGGASTSSATSAVTGTNVSTGSLTDCTDGQCVAAVPNGWNGPVSLENATECANQTSALYQVGLAATPTGTCNCMPSGPPPCTPPTVELFDPQNCSGGQSALLATALTCTDSMQGGIDSAMGDAPATPNPSATCALNGQAPAPNYVSPSLLCQVATGECANGDVCVPVSSQGATCVYATGVAGCTTAGPYSVAHSFVTATSSCDCGTITANCHGSTTLFKGSGCNMSDQKVTVAHPSGCEATSGNVSSALFTPENAAAFAGQCGPHTPTVVSTPMTVCCLP